MDNILKSGPIYWLKAISAVGLFALSGFVSACIFHLGEDQLVTNSLFPGAIFISATVTVFVITRTEFKLSRLLLFCVLMYVTYLAVFFLTLYSSTWGLGVGIFTTGMGSYLTFGLTDRFIKTIHFKPGFVFVLGGIAFLINDTLLIEPIAKFIEPVYVIRGWIHTVFAGTFLFWQVLVGSALFVTLNKG